jgi:hypothetical protein
MPMKVISTSYSHPGNVDEIAGRRHDSVMNRGNAAIVASGKPPIAAMTAPIVKDLQ